jgi:protein-S-isoprenylcysteine O-methyltransferase Ste14
MQFSVLTFVLAFALWAALHSLLAARPVKAWFRRHLGLATDRWYRLAYNAVSVVTLLPVLAVLYALPDRTLYVVGEPWSWVMLAGQVGALIALAFTVLQSGAAGFVGLSQLLGREPLEGARLTETGLYCRSRHPLYFFSLLLLLLSPAMTVNRLLATALVAVYFAVGSWHEERRLLAQFGETYASYRRRVPWMIPRPGPCPPPMS